MRFDNSRITAAGISMIRATAALRD